MRDHHHGTTFPLLCLTQIHSIFLKYQHSLSLSLSLSLQSKNAPLLRTANVPPPIHPRTSIVMLVLPLKSCVRYDLATALATWLDDDAAQVGFVPTNPLQFIVPKPDFTSIACRNDLMRLQSLRNCLCDIFLKSQSHKHALEENGLNDCYEYHAALLEFEKRGFPTLDDDHNGIRLQWKGAFGSNPIEKHGCLIWDRACVTYSTCPRFWPSILFYCLWSAFVLFCCNATI